MEREAEREDKLDVIEHLQAEDVRKDKLINELTEEIQRKEEAWEKEKHGIEWNMQNEILSRLHCHKF